MIAIIAYDISSSRRREKAARLLLDFGERIQYSVFECELTPARLEAVQERLGAVIDPRTDRINIYPLCQACFGRAISAGAPYTLAPDL